MYAAPDIGYPEWVSLWPRLSLFEVHDQAACPELLKQAITDCVTTAWTFTGLWRNTVPHLAELLRRTRTSRIVDLCSGSGGPLPLAARLLQAEFPELAVTLTDLYPKLETAERVARESGGRIDYHRTPVDAMAVPAELRGLRTLFGAFHHFPPTAALRILKSASEVGQPIAIFEFQRRDFLRNMVPPVGLVGLAPLFALWFAPFHLWRVLLTVVPVIPALYAWDSLVSILRTYTPQELAGLAEQASIAGYRWEVREARASGPGRITCLLGFRDERGGVDVIRY